MPKKETYRLNCFLDADLGVRLAECSKKTKLSKVSIVTLALNQYLQQAELLEKIQAEMVNDPAKLAEVCKAFGFTPDA